MFFDDSFLLLLPFFFFRSHLAPGTSPLAAEFGSRQSRSALSNALHPLQHLPHGERRSEGTTRDAVSPESERERLCVASFFLPLLLFLLTLLPSLNSARKLSLDLPLAPLLLLRLRRASSPRGGPPSSCALLPVRDFSLLRRTHSQSMTLSLTGTSLSLLSSVALSCPISTSPSSAPAGFRPRSSRPRCWARETQETQARTSILKRRGMQGERRDRSSFEAGGRERNALILYL